MVSEKKRSASRVVDRYLTEISRQKETWEQKATDRPSWSAKECSLEPLSHITLKATEVVLTLDLPLTEESSVQVKPLDDETLDISAKMRRKVKFEELGITRHRGEFEKLHCHQRMPVPVQMEKMEISYKKGLLQIRLPRRSARS